MSTKTDGIYAEVWKSKDALSASYGHDLAATCKALYAEQAKHPTDFVNLGGKRLAEGVALNTRTAASSIRHDNSTINPQSKPRPRAGIGGLRH